MKKRKELIEIIGAREHNLKNIDLTLPRNKLIVITGISGSGKSSLAFDTIYAEGQRRYMESFSAYARSFIGDMERPDVDKIEGLSPVISIEQKTTSGNPRSTVGTITEIYDFFRLLYARAGDAYSYLSGRKMIRQSGDQIVEMIHKNFDSEKLILLAPVVKGRKGHYRELFVQVRKLGFTKVRVDGEIQDLTSKMQVDRYKTHDIEIVVDRIIVDEKEKKRIRQSINTCLKHGDGVMMLQKQDGSISYFSKNLMDPETGLAYDDPAPNTFSFNSPYGACPECNGLGRIEEISEGAVIPDKSLSISQGGIAPLGKYRDIWIFKKIEAILKKNKVNLATPIEKIPRKVVNMLLYGDNVPVDVSSIKYPGTDWHTKFEGIINFLEKQKDGGSEKLQTWVKEFTDTKICPGCNGFRLKKEALHYRLANKNIGELAMMDIHALGEWTNDLENHLHDQQKIIATEILKELKKRIGFLLNIGLDYLSLNRSLKTLSGGEAQRIRLATQIGTQLLNVLYILDEPSIGLHQRDNVRLIQALKDLRDLGNTVIVVEHDKDMMLESDEIVDIGPGAGRHGGQVVAKGSPKDFLNQHSSTSDYLSGKKKIAIPEARRPQNGNWLELIGASGHNLKDVDLRLPLGNLVLVTGVSGSGKSTLIHETLCPILKKELYKSRKVRLPFRKIRGADQFDKMIEVNQSPIGRTPRSNPVTYTGVFSEIRNLFVQLPEAKIRGYKPGRFSFNVKGGRCETCGGGG
ncbi:MAG: excinuclease ABC subunit UvrA, partial [Ekhidna sp.]|nr:excinuclease ABC subunit UvrA [Ekhidna sp.]